MEGLSFLSKNQFQNRNIQNDSINGQRSIHEKKPQNTTTNNVSQSILDSTKKAAEGIRSQRSKSEDTKLQLKKLRYSFKSISSKLLRCKKSTNAKQIVSEARREVQRLKRQRQSKGTDDEELQNAITHAERMVRVAKKKARHLEEEELVKEKGTKGGICLEEPDEKDIEDEKIEDEEIEGEDSLDDISEEEIYYDEELDIEEQNPDMSSLMDESMELMESFMEDFNEDMKELMEDMGLEDLFEDIGAYPGKEMDPADIKLMKIKHRNSEMKDIVKADADYLKSVFDGISKGGNAALPGNVIDMSVSDMSVSNMSEPQIDLCL